MMKPSSALAAKLSLEEKVNLVSGATAWRTAGIERINLRPMVFSDGPSGVRGENVDFGAGISVPCGSALAATWNPSLVERIGSFLGGEARQKGVNVLLAPTVNMDRSPLAGRNFECYSEDPWLASRAAVAFIRGVQSQGVAATVKHYVGNEAETHRQSADSIIDERALREIYLLPFESAVMEADVQCIMAAYNRVNSTYVSESKALLDDLLREEWGFTGVVVSDWRALHSTVDSASVGLDLEMPGPPEYWGEKLLTAVRNGEVSEADVDRKVTRLLNLAHWVGALGETPANESPEDQSLQETGLLLRQVAAESFVLLRNEPTDSTAQTRDLCLPWSAGAIRKLAVIGPFAASVPQGGGSASLQALNASTPLDGLRAYLSADTQIEYMPGCLVHRQLPSLPPPGSTYVVEYFNNTAFQGAPVRVEHRENATFTWVGLIADQLEPGQCGVRITCKFVTDRTGTYTFSIAGVGSQQLIVNDSKVLAFRTPIPTDSVNLDIPEERGSVYLLEDTQVHVVAEYVPHALGYSKFMIGFLAPTDEDAMLTNAVEAARQADAAVVVVGLGSDWESEGYDRPTLELPGRQNELVHNVLEANKNTVVVVCAGAPIHMPWLDETSAILWTWYAGNEFGNALADVIFGSTEPSGRLPITFPAPSDKFPLPLPDAHDAISYDESLQIGYRAHSISVPIPPGRFPFGYGLGYTQFSYELVQLSTPSKDGTVSAEIHVRNVGSRSGSSTVQLYLSPPDRGSDGNEEPERALWAFTKVPLSAGESTTVTLSIPSRAFERWDSSIHSWVRQNGTYRVTAAQHSADTGISDYVTIT